MCTLHIYSLPYIEIQYYIDSTFSIGNRTYVYIAHLLQSRSLHYLAVFDLCFDVCFKVCFKVCLMYVLKYVLKYVLMYVLKYVLMHVLMSV